MAATGRSPGRPRGMHGTTRASIVAASRAAFATRGFNGVSLRQIAADANVDVSTITYFFGTKHALFQSVVAEEIPAYAPVAAAISAGQPGHEIVASYLALWSPHRNRDVLLGLLRSGTSSVEASEILVQAIMGTAQVADPVPRERVQLVMAQLVGIAVARYIACLPTLVAMTDQCLSIAFGPAIDAILTGQ